MEYPISKKTSIGVVKELFFLLPLMKLHFLTTAPSGGLQTSTAKYAADLLPSFIQH